jgi:hypothetical protein
MKREFIIPPDADLQEAALMLADAVGPDQTVTFDEKTKDGEPIAAIGPWRLQEVKMSGLLATIGGPKGWLLRRTDCDTAVASTNGRLPWGLILRAMSPEWREVRDAFEAMQKHLPLTDAQAQELASAMQQTLALAEAKDEVPLFMGIVTWSPSEHVMRARVCFAPRAVRMSVAANAVKQMVEDLDALWFLSPLVAKAVEAEANADAATFRAEAELAIWKEKP